MSWSPPWRQSIRLSGVMDNPAFRRWFGNSVVRNPDGSPKVVYHGTISIGSKVVPNFRVFEPGWKDIGIHFGTAGQAYERIKAMQRTRPRTDARVYPVYIRIERPLRLRDVGQWGPMEMAIRLAKDARSAQVLRPLVAPQLRERSDDRGTRFLTPEEVRQVTNVVMQSKEDSKELNAILRPMVVRMIQNRGYDGIIYSNTFEVAKSGAEDSYIVFDPRQIKGVNNRGTFDPNDPDILHGWKYR